MYKIQKINTIIIKILFVIFLIVILFFYGYEQDARTSVGNRSIFSLENSLILTNIPKKSPE